MLCSIRNGTKPDLRAYGFTITIQEESQPEIKLLKEVWEGKNKDVAHGIAFRAVKPYRLDIKSVDNTWFYIRESRLVLLPDTAPDHTLVLDYSRLAFVKKTTNIGFVDGVPQNLTQKAPSSVLGFLAIPKGIIQAIVPLPPAITGPPSGVQAPGTTGTTAAPQPSPPSPAPADNNFAKQFRLVSREPRTGDKMKPYLNSDPYRYSRLFAPFEDPLPEEIRNTKLRKLAESMKASQSPIPFPAWKSTPIGAGYTYFGQFVDHDLTEDRTPLRLAGGIEPKDTENARTCWLDLDNLYGHGPGCPIYAPLYQDETSFRLGETLVDNETFDVPLTGGRPHLADPRNNENILVRQMHVLFLKLHNLAVNEVKKTMPSLGARDLFAKAQERVRWQYQWLVRHDYLEKICNRDVYQDVITGGYRRIDWSDGFSIPVEFSQAAFRFGHSMVQAQYDLKGKKEVPLTVLFAEARRALDPMFAVDWTEFFEGNQRSMRIDTGIVQPLFNLPDEDISRFVNAGGPHTTKELPLRTLLRARPTAFLRGNRCEINSALTPLCSNRWW